MSEARSDSFWRTSEAIMLGAAMRGTAFLTDASLNIISSSFVENEAP
jgi:hypothetical protein